MLRFIYLTLLVSGFGIKANSQDVALPDRMTGNWQGYLQIWSAGEKKDSVRVALSIKSNGKETWQWRMEYFSQNPVVKDYVIRLKDKAKQIYVTDEGDGIELEDYVFGDKMFSLFETQGYWLTSTMELKNGILIFEVTSGKKTTTLTGGITNYSISNLQQAILTRSY